MTRARAIATMAVSLVVLAILAAAVPASAHVASTTAVTVLPAPDLLPAPSAPAEPATHAASSWLLAAALLLGLALAIAGAWRRPRRALMLALAVLLAIFAFENALHSVHHGFDAKQYAECTIAAASAHLSVVSVEDVPETSVVLIASERTAEPDPAPPTTRLLEPDQGRAPPTATA